MKKYIIFFLLFACLGKFSSAYWEWTPKTGKWINPKYAVKETAEKQFAHAENLRQQGETDNAIREHRKLLKHFPDSSFAAESAFALGGIYQKLGKDRTAFEYYQKISDEYPQSPLVIEAIKRQSAIAEKFLEQEHSLMTKFFSLGKKEKGRYLKDVIENSPYSEQAPERTLKLALFYYQLKQYDQAREELELIVENYPDTRQAEEANYYLIKLLLDSVPEVTTSVEQYKTARRKIENFLVRYPESIYKKDVLALMDKINDIEAGKYYKIASYYERAGEKRSAEFYYRKIAEEYPGTKYGEIVRKKFGGR
jgi:outer membrane protein assembly factor BamD (BamD/ComL family)